MKRLRKLDRKRSKKHKKQVRQEQINDIENMDVILERLSSAIGYNAEQEQLNKERMSRDIGAMTEEDIRNAMEDEEEGENYDSDDGEEALYGERIRNAIAKMHEKYREHAYSAESWLEEMRDEVRRRRNSDIANFFKTGGKSSNTQSLTKIGEGTQNSFAHDIGLKHRLLHHQLAAVAWLMLRENNVYKGQRAAILADEMGAGKTLTALTLVAMDRVCGFAYDNDLEVPHFKPTLVACPHSVITEWQRQVQEHFDNAYMRICVMENRPQHEKRMDILNNDVVLVSYSTMRIMLKNMQGELYQKLNLEPELFPPKVVKRYRSTPADKLDLTIGCDTIWADTDKWIDKHFLFLYPWRRFITDECSFFKNNKVVAWNAVASVRAERRIAISGTPMENNISDLYSLLGVLRMTPDHMTGRESSLWWRNIVPNADDPDLAYDPDGESGARLRRRFLNVLQLRRQMESVSLVDPLASYVRRRNDTLMGHLWDNVVESRKRLRSLKREANKPRNAAHIYISESESDEDDEVSWGGATTLEQAERIADKARKELSDYCKRAGISEGFYLDTYQSAFEDDYDEVNVWLKHVFGLRIEQIQANISEARRRLYDCDISRITTFEEHNYVFSSLPYTWRDGRNIDVALLKVDPVVLTLVDKMSPMERAVYNHLVTMCNDTYYREMQKHGYTGLEEEEEDSEDHKKARRLSRSALAFTLVSRLRATAGDYRVVEESVKYLQENFPDAKGGPKMVFGAPGARMPDSILDKTKLYRIDVKDTNQYKEQEEEEEDGEDSNDAHDDGQPEEKVEAMPKLPAPPEKREAEPCRVYETPEDPPTKYKMLLRYLQIAPAEDKVVVFSDQVRFFPIMRDYLKMNGHPTDMITGKMSNKNRNKVIERFRKRHTGNPRANGIRVLLASMRCTSMGLNLQMANHAIMFVMWWNPSIEEQCLKRVSRLDQKKVLYFVFLVIEDAIDRFILPHSENATKMVTNVTHGGNDVLDEGVHYNRPQLEEAIFMDTNEKADRIGGETKLCADSSKGATSFQEFIDARRFSVTADGEFKMQVGFHSIILSFFLKISRACLQAVKSNTIGSSILSYLITKVKRETSHARGYSIVFIATIVCLFVLKKKE